ncbi:hypothetical protein ACF08B_25340 [Streptomyces sp. NPDC015139]|uniref:hypothetical protein n=1 Tax=Streptomyces sp. NPDC015139 TaxID=3364942 RepID=UPI0036FE6287
MISEFSDAFLLEAERHAAWGAAQLEVLTGFLPDGPWGADLPGGSAAEGHDAIGRLAKVEVTALP